MAPPQTGRLRGAIIFDLPSPSLHSVDNVFRVNSRTGRPDAPGYSEYTIMGSYLPPPFHFLHTGRSAVPLDSGYVRYIDRELYVPPFQLNHVFPGYSGNAVQGSVPNDKPPRQPTTTHQLCLNKGLKGSTRLNPLFG